MRLLPNGLRDRGTPHRRNLDRGRGRNLARNTQSDILGIPIIPSVELVCGSVGWAELAPADVTSAIRLSWMPRARTGREFLLAAGPKATDTLADLARNSVTTGWSSGTFVIPSPRAARDHLRCPAAWHRDIASDGAPIYSLLAAWQVTSTRNSLAQGVGPNDWKWLDVESYLHTTRSTSRIAFRMLRARWIGVGSTASARWT